MIDNSQRITVVYDDESKVFSGTYRALLYAKTKETEIIQIPWMKITEDI